MKTAFAFPKIGAAVCGGIFVSIATGKDSNPYALVKLNVTPDKAAEGFDDYPIGMLAWHEAIAWARRHGGALPTRAEAELLRANVPALLPSEVWTSEDEGTGDAGKAWVDNFQENEWLECPKEAPAEVVAIKRVPLAELLPAQPASVRTMRRAAHAADRVAEAA